jgi:ABC-type Zn uptake system ZnuABC Zn-binding protein ZnuA
MRSWLVGLLLAVVLLACAALAWRFVASRSSAPRPERLAVCASLFPLYEWAKEVADPDADVGIVGAAADPHHFEPTLSDLALIGRARVLLVVGLGLEPWSRRAAHPPGAGQTPELWEAGTWVATRRPDAAHAHQHAVGERGDERHEEAGHAEEGGADPHVWLDPVRAARIVRRLGGEFARVDPAHAEGYRQRSERYAGELMRLADELQELARPLAGRKVVVFHDAYGYLLERLGLERALAVQPCAGVEPGARDVAEAAQKLRELGQQVVFAEVSHQAQAQALAETIGGRVVNLDTLTAAQAPWGRTYAERLRYNVRALLEGLK